MSTERATPKQFEARLIQLLAWRFKKSGFSVFDHHKVGELPLEIDLVAIPPEPEWTPDYEKFPRLFAYFRRYNIIEVKTEQDRVELADLPKLMAYGWMYMAKNELVNVSEVTLTALVHHLPASILEALPLLGFVPKMQGIYQRESAPAAYVISFADAPEELVPEELRAFCDKIRRRQTFLECLHHQEKAQIAETIFDLYESEVKHIMLNLREETMRNVFSEMDPRKFLAAFGVERLFTVLDEDQIVAAIGQERLAKFAARINEDQIAAALGQEKLASVAASIDKEKLIAALGGSENLLRSLLASLTPEQRRQLLESYN